MGLKDKVKFNILVDPDDPQTLILMPVDGEIQDGSTYTLNIKDLQFTDGSVSSHKETFITTPSENFFCSVQDVLRRSSNECLFMRRNRAICELQIFYIYCISTTVLYFTIHWH